jgi:TRAP-type mannitol/chloroaromatic compound transport system permease small subunit
MIKAIIAWMICFGVVYIGYEMISSAPKRGIKSMKTSAAKAAAIATVITIGFVLFVFLF